MKLLCGVLLALCLSIPTFAEHAKGHKDSACCEQEDCCKDCKHKDGKHSCCEDKKKAEECCKNCKDRKCKKACASGKCKDDHCEKHKGKKSPEAT